MFKKIRSYLPVSLAFLLLVILFGCNSKSQKAEALLEPKSGSNVKGKITFTKEGNTMKVLADIEGLTPGLHGFHIHEKGDCSAPDGTSAGGHFNPKSMKHAGPDSPERHEGDLGNIKADESGKAHLDITDSILTFDGESSILGKSVIVHENADDLTTQPTGNAGGRVACGIITIVN
ncbi:MAG TPA: superoxide dismutase family protein [Ignavibacteria bacterium]|nr:superoxide dismutase family protein [Ignavibacteria bacterium]HMR41039.1 superoxide dismutase family protein [Ignavibacteria bacterium]